MRRLPSALGFLALGLAWLALASDGGRAFYVHMSAHMGVVAVAAPLLALGVTGTRYDPSRRAPGLFAPIPASLVEFVTVWAWHAPALHHAARHRAAWAVAEQASFLVTGLWVWVSALGGRDAPGRERTAAGVVALLLTSMHMTLLGALIGLSPRVLYPACGGHTSLASLDDQHLGGAVMLIVGGASYLAGGVALTRGLLQTALRRA